MISEWLDANGFEQSTATIRMESGLRKSLPKKIMQVRAIIQKTVITIVAIIQSEFGLSDENTCTILDQVVAEQLTKNKISKQTYKIEYDIPNDQKKDFNEIIIEK